MEWNQAGEADGAATRRIVALLYSFADLASQAGARSLAVRASVLWLLLVAEAVTRNLFPVAAAPSSFRHAGLSRADAMRLARRFRNLARALDRQAASLVRLDGIGQAYPACGRELRALYRAACPNLVGLLAIPAAMRVGSGRTVPADTS